MTETVPVPVDLLKRLRDTYPSTVTSESWSPIAHLAALIPAEPPKVGEILTADQITALPNRSVILDRDNDPWVLEEGMPIYYAGDERRDPTQVMEEFGPLTLALLGKPRD